MKSKLERGGYGKIGVGANAEFCTLLFFLLLRGPRTANDLILVYTSVPSCQCNSFYSPRAFRVEKVQSQLYVPVFCTELYSNVIQNREKKEDRIVTKSI